MPFPSLRCKTCRERRIKCSEDHPACEQCRRSNRECTWDRDPTDRLAFRSENLFASGASTRRKKPSPSQGGSRQATPSTRTNSRARQTSSQAPSGTSDRRMKQGESAEERSRSRQRQDASSQEAVTFTDDGVRSPDILARDAIQVVVTAAEGESFSALVPLWNSQPGPTLSPSLDDVALNFYLNRYLDSPLALSGDRNSYETYLISCLSRAQPGSALEAAMGAASLASFGRYHHHGAAISRSHHRCVEALEATKEAIGDPILSRSSELLLAVMLLGSYENRVVTPDSQGYVNMNTFPFTLGYRHHQGAGAIIYYRQQSDLSEPEIALNRFVRRQILRSSIHHNIPIPLWLRDGAVFGESGIDLLLDRCMVQVVDLRVDIRKQMIAARAELALDATVFPVNLADLVYRGRSIDHELVAWSELLRTEWSYSELDRSPRDQLPDDPVYGNTTHAYTSFTQAGLWNYYRTCRLLCNMMIVRAVRLVRQHGVVVPSAELDIADQAVQNAHGLVDEICASVPYFLGIGRQPAQDGSSSSSGGGSQSSESSNGDRWSPTADVSPGAAFMLVFPLIICLVACRAPVQVAWLQGRLKAVGQITASGTLEALASVDIPSKLDAPSLMN